MNVQFAARKIDNQFEGALIVDNRFARSGRGTSLVSLFTSLAGSLLVAETQADGVEVSISVAIIPPGQDAKTGA